jgi:inorganic pyrophosphatase
MIGKTVIVSIDRPIHSRHPKYKDMVYPCNYGYVKGYMGGDGEWQDAYVLGIDYPVETFTGRVIAIVKRQDDVEDKWVVSNEDYTIDEIRDLISFQEQYFKYTIIM